MYNGPEKRQYKRIEKPFTARFRIRSGKAQERESDDWNSVNLMNLGVGGTFFYYRKDLGIGTLLDLEIDVSKSTPPINCVGKIIRIDEPIPISTFGIATEFTGIEEHEKEMINTTLLKRY